METTVQMSSLSPILTVIPVAVIVLGIMLIAFHLVRPHKKSRLEPDTSSWVHVIAMFFVLLPAAFLLIFGGEKGPSTEDVAAQIAEEHGLTKMTSYGSDIFRCSENRGAAEQKYSWVDADGKKKFGTLYSDQGANGECAYTLVLESDVSEE